MVNRPNLSLLLEVLAPTISGANMPKTKLPQAMLLKAMARKAEMREGKAWSAKSKAFKEAIKAKAKMAAKRDVYSFFETDTLPAPLEFAPSKYKRKLVRQSSDDEDEVPAIKPCIVLLTRDPLCEAAWQREQKSIEERLKIETQQQRQNGNSSGRTSPVVRDCEFQCLNNNNNYNNLHSARQQQPTPPPAAMGDYPRFLLSKGAWILDTHSLKCDICDKRLQSPYKLKDHAETEHGMMIEIKSPADSGHSGGSECVNFPCTQCPKVCKTKKSLEKHMRGKHTGQTNNHERNSEREANRAQDNAKCKVYECPYCFTLHANKDRFKKHLGFVQYNYSDCQFTTDNATLLRQKDPVKCEVCGSKAANLAFLHAHQSTHVELPRPNECPDDECRKKFVFTCQLNRHMLLHQVKSSPPPLSPGAQKGPKDRFRCPLCAKRTRTKAKMDQHVDTCHKPDVCEFKCVLCNISYASIKQLKSHYSKKHEGMEMPTMVVSGEAEAAKEEDRWPLPDPTYTPFPASQVEPELMGSDSVSASDAFSMYFQSLNSLNPIDMDIPLDLEGNMATTEKILSPLDCASPVQTSLPAPLQQVSPEFSGLKNESELQFHTLQTVQHSDARITFLHSSAPVAEESNAVPTELLVPSLESTSFYQLEQKQENICEQVVSFTPAEQPVSLNTQMLPVFAAPVMEYDPKLDLAIEQELEQNTKELQEIFQKTKINCLVQKTKIDCLVQKTKINCFISVPESEVVAGGATPSVAVAAPAVATVATVATVAAPQPEVVVQMQPTPENFEKIVQEILHPNEPSPQPQQQPLPPPLTLETVKQKLAAKTKKKKEEKPVPEVLPEIAPTGQEDCKLCHKVFGSHELLIKHVQQNCAGKNQPGADTVCQLCGERLSDRKLYLKHKKEQHPESLLPCPACDKLFFLAQSLARHTKQTCSRRVDYTCRKCKKAFDSLDALRTHTQTDHPENVVCHICKKVLASSQSLKRHVKSHDKEVPSSAASSSEPVFAAVPLVNELDESGESSDSILRRVSLNQLDNVDANDDLSLPELSSWGDNIDNNLAEEMLLCGNRSDTACEFCGADFASEQLLLDHLSSQHFPNTQWQPLARNLPVADDPSTVAAAVSCNDS
ncbi:Hypothetical predicted protein [Cloeon dipterum]|uniref:C2H2-type domain-containing protein n=1 Tax=Cloeon dipterum TaxID=197152 RepID=A0A8S1C0C1_9INSE|nr:Hypothetical predicted protein [Cloeon dipterum]